MAKKLLLLFSLLFFVGCTQKEIVYIKSRCPSFRYEPAIPESKTFTFSNKNDKIVLSKQDFKEILENYSFMKNELNQTKQYIKEYNKMIQRINDAGYSN